MPSPFRIDRASATPVYVQLGEQIRLLIHRGVLQPGDPMPTVRSLAVELGINANTVTRVYRELQQQGLLRLERGIGTFVDRPADAATLDHQVWIRITTKAGELVSLCLQAGITRRELSQLLDGTWKEKNDER